VIAWTEVADVFDEGMLSPPLTAVAAKATDSSATMVPKTILFMVDVASSFN